MNYLSLRPGLWISYTNSQSIILLPNYKSLTPLAKGQRAIVMALCPSCVCSSMHASINSLQNFSSETIDWIFTKLHRNVP